MLCLVNGRAGSGKSTYIYKQIKQSVEKDNKVFFITPQQNAVYAERRLARMLKDVDSSGLEVLNFSRLPNHVARRYGELSYSPIGRGTKRVILWRTMCSIAPALRSFGDINISNIALLDSLLDVLTEFKMYNITPPMLNDCIDKLPASSTALRDKIADIAMIFSANNIVLHERYDDPADALTKLAKTLKNHSFFAGADVYFDGFQGFTPQQFSVFSEILRQAERVTISIDCPVNGDEDLFKEIDDFYHKLIRTAAKQNTAVAIPVQLNKNYRAQNEELRILEEQLFRQTVSDNACYSEVPRHIRLLECNTPFDEAEWIAADIASAVKNGARYRDFAVAIRNCNRYDGIIDAVFQKYNIPFFFSKRDDICAKPLIQLIFSVLSVYEHQYRQKDLIAYIKTGLCGISDEQCDRFENYVTMWNISGKRFAVDEDFNMNPDGFTNIWTDQGRERVAEMNEIRRYLLDSTEPLFSVLREDKATVKSISCALITYLESLNLEDQLTTHEQNADEDHIIILREFATLWDALMQSLEELVFAAGDMECSCSAYRQLLQAVIGDVDIGKIPSSPDEVMIAEAALIRSDEIEKIYIPGTNEGQFPSADKNRGLLEEYDREMLKEAGIELSADAEKRVRDEMFCFYSVASLPQKEIMISCSRYAADGTSQRPSVVYDEILRIFPHISVEKVFALPPLQRLHSKQCALEVAIQYPDCALGQAVRDYYREDALFQYQLKLSEQKISEIHTKITPETVQLLFGSEVSLSYSRLECYTNCRLSFYLKYILKLKEQKKNEIRDADIGTFMHDVFFKFLKAFCNSETRSEVYGQHGEKLPEYIHALTESYTTSMFGQGHADGKLGILSKRLERAALVAVKNLSEEFLTSKFYPCAFEYSIGENAAERQSSKILLSDGCTVRIFGAVDRIDTYTQDNKTYLRVIDYKTGSRKFDLDEIKKGRNMQLFLYLSTLCEAKPSAFGENIIPAGVLYMYTKPPSLSFASKPDFFEVCRESDKTMGRQGLLISDRDIVEAMEPGLQGRFLPVSIKKNGEFRQACIKNMADQETFYHLMRDIRDSVTKIAEKLKSGSADALGIYKDSDGKLRSCRAQCEYCPMKPICRIL